MAAKAGEKIPAPERHKLSPRSQSEPSRATDTLLASHDRSGNAAIGRWLRTRVGQGDVRVSEPGDPHEREARQVAGALRSRPMPARPPRLSAGADTAPTTEVGARLIDGLGPGEPLASLQRTRFEASLGHDLSAVRVHSSPAAATAASAVRAHAFTVGSHIAFARGRWSPDTETGQQLLAHEVVHAAQHRTGDRLISRADDGESGEVSAQSDVEQHMLRQYGRLFYLLPLDQWQSLVRAAEVRADKQAASASSTVEYATAIQVPLDTILDPRARFVDINIWDTLFDLFYRNDEGPTAGILIRNEICRQWFTTNGVDPKRDQVTISLIDPDGLQDSPAQFDFIWRKQSIADTLGAIDLEWLEKPVVDQLTRALRYIVPDVTNEARRLGEAAALKKDKERIEPKLPAVIAQAQADLSKATLDEIEAYQQLVTQDADLAYKVRERSARADAYIPGVAEYFSQTNHVLFKLVNDVRDWRVGGAVVTDPENPDVVQQRIPSDREVHLMLGDPRYEASEPEKLYIAGQLSYSGKEELEQAMADRMLITTLVSVALSFATLGFGGWVAEGIGLAEGTLGYGIVQAGVSGLTTGVGTTAAADIVTRAMDLDDPRAQALWKDSGPTLSTYFKAAGLGFLTGAGLALVFAGAFAAWRAFSAWRAAGQVAVEEPLFVVLSDTVDATSKVRTVQMRGINGELMTLSTNAENTGYIWSSATGQMRRIENGVVGEQVLMLTAGSEHVEMLEQLEQMLVSGPPNLVQNVERLQQAVDAFRAGQATLGDLEIVFNEIVADYRAFRMAGRPQGAPDVLDYQLLLGQCGEGRDITMASLAMMTERTGQSVTVWRFQAEELFERLGGEKHAFSIIEFDFMPGRRFLVDPTFAQFLRPGQFGAGGPFVIPPKLPGPEIPSSMFSEGEGVFTGNILKTDLAGTRFAHDLVRDGFIELTEENARQYVRGLGIPEAQIEEMAGRVVNAERAQLQETIGAGGTGAVTHIPVRGPQVLDINGVDQEITTLVGRIQQNGTSAERAAQLPRLYELQQRVRSFMSNEDNFLLWDQATHSPGWRPLPDQPLPD